MPDLTDEPSGQDAGPAQVADIAQMQDYWRGGTGQSAADASAAPHAAADAAAAPHAGTRQDAE